MKNRVAGGLLAFFVASSPSVAIATDSRVTPEQVIRQFVANATRTPPGAVETQVTSEMTDTCAKIKKAMDDSRSVREMIASTFDRVTLLGSFRCLWSQGSAAIWSAKAKVTADGIQQCEDEASNNSETLIVNGKPVSTQTGSGPMFGDAGGFETFVGSKVPSDGQVIATFCVVQQHGVWKVHCAYISPGPLQSDDLSFIVRNFSAFAKKQ